MPKPVELQLGDSSTPTDTKRQPAYKRLSRATEALILQLSKEGKTQTQIAQMVGCSQPSVSLVLSSFQDTREQAKQHLNNKALALAERVIKHANVEESLEVLDRLEVAPKKDKGAGSHMGIQIHIGMPGQAIGPSPIIDLSPVSPQQLAEKSTG